MKEQLAQHGLFESITVVPSFNPDVIEDKRWATIVRKYLPELDLEYADETRIALIQQNMQQRNLTRCHMEELIEVGTVLAKRMDISTLQKIGDEVLLLSDQINGHFACNRRAIIECPPCPMEGNWLNARAQPIYSLEELNDKQLFVTMSVHTWRCVRDICCC